jgi:hypothetical protein
MKHIIIAIALLTTIHLKAQDNFSLNEGEVIWQKVYETTKAKEAVISYFKNSDLFKSFKVEGDKIIGTLNPQSIDKDDKEIAGTLPPAITVKASYTGTVSITLKDEKYRVTFTDIFLVGNGEMI